jgi:hypothetical protein
MRLRDELWFKGPRVVPEQALLHPAGRRSDRRANHTHLHLHLNWQDGRRSEYGHAQASQAIIVGHQGDDRAHMSSEHPMTSRRFPPPWQVEQIPGARWLTHWARWRCAVSHEKPHILHSLHGSFVFSLTLSMLLEKLDQGQDRAAVRAETTLRRDSDADARRRERAKRLANFYRPLTTSITPWSLAELRQCRSRG